jgi:2'-5' RNA ligase
MLLGLGYHIMRPLSTVREGRPRGLLAGFSVLGLPWAVVFDGGRQAAGRLFIAVNCTGTVRSRLLAVQAALRAQAVRGAFPPPENLHLTLIFLGETPESHVPAIRSRMAALRRGPFTLILSRIGCFTRSRKELWWAGAGSGDPGLAELTGLRQRLAAGLAEAGIAFDDRPFNAHITLGREIRHVHPLKTPPVHIAVPVNRISLMRSERESGRLVYTELFGAELFESERFGQDLAEP